MWGFIVATLSLPLVLLIIVADAG
jgi:hypothetical protein